MGRLTLTQSTITNFHIVRICYSNEHIITLQQQYIAYVCVVTEIKRQLV